MFNKNRYMNYYMFKRTINALIYNNKCNFMLIYDNKSY